MGSTVRASRSTARSDPLNPMFRRPHAAPLAARLGPPPFLSHRKFSFSNKIYSPLQAQATPINTVSPLHENLQVLNFQRCERAPVCQLLYCTTVLFKVLYCKIKNIFLFFMYYLFEKYHKPITVQYYRADYVNWVPRLTLLDLRTNWTYKRALGTELVRM